MKTKTAAPTTGATEQNRKIDYTFAFRHISSDHLPFAGSKSKIALRIFVDGKQHPKEDFNKALRDNPRGPLQRLRNQTYDYWLIHNQTGLSNPASYQLISRHFTGDRKDDAVARREATNEAEFDKDGSEE